MGGNMCGTIVVSTACTVNVRRWLTRRLWSMHGNTLLGRLEAPNRHITGDIRYLRQKTLASGPGGRRAANNDPCCGWMRYAYSGVPDPGSGCIKRYQYLFMAYIKCGIYHWAGNIKHNYPYWLMLLKCLLRDYFPGKTWRTNCGFGWPEYGPIVISVPGAPTADYRG